MDAAPKFGNELYVDGLISLSQGFLLTSMIYSAIVVFMVEKQLRKASLWALAAACLSFFGILHAYRITNAGEENLITPGAAPAFTAAYGLVAVVLFALSFRRSTK